MWRCIHRQQRVDIKNKMSFKNSSEEDIRSNERKEFGLRDRRATLLMTVMIYYGFGHTYCVCRVRSPLLFSRKWVFQEVQVSTGSWVNDMQNNVFVYTEGRLVLVSDATRHKFIQNMSNQAAESHCDVMYTQQHWLTKMQWAKVGVFDNTKQ